MPGPDLALLIEAAEAAGRLARRHWRRMPRAWEKPDAAGPVTEADLAIDRMLRERLLGARPGYGWLSEESAPVAAAEGARGFIVDPLDGTRAFIAGDRAFSHALAVVENGRSIAAAVYLPMLGRLYAAERGGGATLNRQPIRVRRRRSLDGAEALATRAALAPEHWQGPVPRMSRHVRAALSYRLCLVAEGRFDLVLSLRDTWHWDSVAGGLILEEAGGCVSDVAGRALAPGAPAVPRSAGLVGASRPLHGRVITRLAPRAGVAAAGPAPR